MIDPGATVRWDWGEKVPLADQWRHKVGRRDKMLAYWIEMSATDEWTFAQLQALLADFLDAGEPVPTTLQAWANDVAIGRRRGPSRRGPKGDRTRDARIAAAVHILSEAGMSERAAKRLLSGALHKSEEAIESARARGRRVGKLIPK